MSCVASTPVIRLALVAPGTSFTVVHWFPPFPLVGGEDLDVMLRVTNGTNGFTVAPALQYAAVKAGTWSAPAEEGSGTTSELKVNATLSTVPLPVEEVWPA